MNVETLSTEKKGAAPCNRYGRSLLLLLLCWLPLALAAAREPGTTQPVPTYYLDELALGLREVSESLRADLAHIAISELAEAYDLEFQRARQEMRRHPGERDLRRWAVAVERLAAELAALAETVTATTPVHAGIGPDNSVYLIVDGKPVVISGPRKRDQAALEQRIISRFCSLNPCDRLIPAPLQTESESAPSPMVTTTHWSFSEKAGPLCTTDDGLAFQFQNAGDLRRKREACARVVAELHTLAVEISHRKARGTRVDWNALAIHTLPLGDEQQVELNSDGDSLNLYLPALAAAPDLFVLLRPWLAAKVNGVRHDMVVSDAEVLLPPLGFLGQ